MGLKDRHLIDGFVRGEQHAFNIIYQELAPFLLLLARRYTKDIAVAEDIVQEAFVDLFLRRKDLISERIESPDKYIYGYMAKVVRNKCIDYFRRENVRESRLRNLSDYHPTSTDPNVFRAELEAEALGQLRQVVSVLSKTEKEIFELVVLNERSVEEASQILNVSKKRIDNVRSKINGLLRAKFPAFIRAISLAILFFRDHPSL